jgi:hypothetical protein
MRARRLSNATVLDSPMSVMRALLEYTIAVRPRDRHALCNALRSSSVGIHTDQARTSLYDYSA